MMKMIALCLPIVFLAACGPARAPQDHEPLVDGRGGHAGTFNAPGDGNNVAVDSNSQVENSQ